MQGVDRPTACHQYLCTTILQRKNEEVKDYTACLLQDTQTLQPKQTAKICLVISLLEEDEM